MNRENYIRLMDWGKTDQKRSRRICLLNELTTDFIYVMYPALVLYLAVLRDARWWKVVLVPAVSFLLVSAFRYFYDEKRPYEAFDYEPVMKKRKQGKSMPSRHVFSATVIATAYLYISPLPAVVVFVCASLMCAGRVLAGVHYPKDVIVGALLGIGIGIIGFFIL